MLADPSLTVLALAVAWDGLLGEPPNRVHPVVWIGRLGRAVVARAPRTGALAQLVAGAAIVVVVPGVFVAATVLAWPVVAGSWLGVVLAAWWLKATFAARALGDAARGVRDPLTRGDLAGARDGLRSLCSRDSAPLDGTQLAASAVESVAENASDSVVAPLFYYALLGLPGAIAYRAVNTLDALIGYRGRYEHLGKATARLDDLLNLIPARLTAALLLVAGAVARADVRGGWRIWRRDAGATASPNAGRPMATMAGLLGVRLDKAGHYQLGDARTPVTPTTIDAAWRITQIAFVLAIALCAAVIA